MAKILVILFFLSTNVFAGFAVISDLDDTLKRTNVENTVRAAYNALFTRNVFTGADNLLRAYESVSDVFILSASPDLFRKNIFKLLEEKNLNPVDVFTRDFEDLADKIKYKRETIQEVMGKGYEGVVLFGDDVEADPKVYLDYKNSGEEEVLAVYIRKVRGARLRKGITYYYTAYEVALMEAAAGRLGEELAYQIGREILDGDMDETIPDWAVCPNSAEEIHTADLPGFEELSRRVKSAIVRHCRRGLNFGS